METLSKCRHGALDRLPQKQSWPNLTNANATTSEFDN